MVKVVGWLPVIKNLVTVLYRRIGSCDCVRTEEGVEGDVQWEVEWRRRSLQISSVSLWMLD